MNPNAGETAHASARTHPPELAGGAYTGWLVSALIIAVVLGIGAVLWFTYHP